MIRPDVVEKLQKIDFEELDRGIREIEVKLYKKGIIDWVDRSWEHPDPNVDAVFGDLHTKRLDDRHGHCAAYLDSCMMCSADCDRIKDTGWTCGKFLRKEHQP